MSNKWDREISNFSWGLNTLEGAHELDPRELRLADWIEPLYGGGITKARAPSVWCAGAAPSASKVQGMCAFATVGGTQIVLAVLNGALYKVDGTSYTKIPIRSYPVQNTTAVQRAAGAVGPNLAITTYEYAITTTLAGFPGRFSPATSVSILTVGPLTPIDITGQASWDTASTTTFELMRKTGAQWQIADGYSVQRVQKDMGGGRIETRVEMVDDGNLTWVNFTDPFPIPNASELTLHATNYVDFQVDGATATVYFTNGNGIYSTNGTTATAVIPAVYDATYGDNSMRNFASTIFTCRALAFHQNYAFAMNNNTEPSKAFYSRLGRWDYWPGLAVLNCPDSNARILEATTIYKALAFTVNQSRYTLHGEVFTPNSANFNGYWSKVSGIGSPTGRTSVRIPVSDREVVAAVGHDGDVHGLSSDAAVESYFNTRRLAHQVSSRSDPNLRSLGDYLIPSVNYGPNMVATFHNDRYILSDPQGQRVWIGYPNRREDGALAWYGPYAPLAISCFATLEDGTLLCGDYANGKIYNFDGAYSLVGGAAYTAKARTKTFIEKLKIRKVRRVYVKGNYLGTSSTCTAKMYAEGVATQDTTLNFFTGGGVERAPMLRTTLRGKGRAIAYEVSNAVAGEALTVFGFYELFDLKKAK